MRADPANRGFSLVEVATSIGIIAFALVALLGLFPLGLENSRLTISDTHATQLVKTIATTLESEPFNQAECFSSPDAPEPSLDLTTLGTESDSSAISSQALSDNPDAVLYAFYDVSALPRLVRNSSSSSPPTGAIYRVELRFRREMFKPVSSSKVASRVAGVGVNLRLFGAHESRLKTKPFSESWIYVPNLAHP